MINHSSKIIITGGLGFIGSNFILDLLSKNEEISIINLDDELLGSNQLSLKKIENLLKDAESDKSKIDRKSVG
jgi:dTDP-D-glucose 4,6-dehydratase